jgi:hypothetical protein
VLFLTGLPDSTAYVFDRKRRTFFRAQGRRNNEVRHFLNAVSLPCQLADSLVLDQVSIGEEMVSAVIRDVRGKIIGLRGVRAQAEKKWRREHGLPETPVAGSDIDDPRSPHPTDWGPITPASYAVDADAIWIGLAPERSIYLDFALGGILRVDRRTNRVTVVEDSSILHSHISQIEPSGDGYLIISDANVLRFDPRTMRATRTSLAGDARELIVENDTVFVAGTGRMTVASLVDGGVLSRGFRLEIRKDSIQYAPADTTIAPSWDTLAIIGAAERLRIRRLNDWLKTAHKIVRAEGLEYFYPGDRVSEVVPVDEADSAVSEDYPREGPNAIVVVGLDDRRLRPFLREALLEHSSYAHLDITKILLAGSDTAAVPFLRVALKNMTGPYQAELATALALLGDSTGNRWIHAALLDTLHAVGTLDTLEHIHSFTFEAAARVRDPRNVGRLLELSSHPRYGFGATAALLSYRSAELAEKLFARAARNDSMGVLAQFLDFIVGDSTFPMTSTLRDSIRSGAVRLLYHHEPRWRYSGAHALGKFADPADLPALIGALTIDEFSYPYAVVELVRLTGTGSAAMPNGKGSPVERAAAQRWWQAWYAAHRNGLKLEPRPPSDPEVISMWMKLNR